MYFYHAGGILTALGLWEYHQGRSLFGKHGFQVWCPGINDSCTSQSILDPYSLTHISHGLIMSAVLRNFSPLSDFRNFQVATTAEGLWEAVENSEWGINNYRTKGYPGYRGDSILNSVSDLGMAITGHILGSYMTPLQCLILVGILDSGLELSYGDSLTRNVLSLVGVLKKKE